MNKHRVFSFQKTFMNRRSILILLAVFVPGLILLFLFTPDAPSKPYYTNFKPPFVIAHQGGDGVWPGDTLYAFEQAVNIGADVLEMDAHITKPMPKTSLWNHGRWMILSL
jgi:glycerophosphoryl diester phosphodiesterase